MIKINNVNIWTYKLRLQSWSGDLTIPARKKTTEEWHHTQNDIFIEEREIVFKFIGQYNNEADLGSNFAALTANLLASIELSVELELQHGTDPLLDQSIIYYGRFVSGIKPVIKSGVLLTFDLVMKWQGLTNK